MRRLLLVLLLLCASCASRSGSNNALETPETRSFGDPNSIKDTPPPANQGTAGGVPAGATARPATARTFVPSTPGPRRTLGPAKPRDDGNVGANSKLYIQGTVSKLVIELGVVKNKGPVQASLDYVKAQLDPVLDKPGGIEFRLTDTFPASRDRYTFADLAAFEEAHRKTHSSTSEASMYVLFVNGDIQGSEGALGIAYGASNIVMLTDSINDVTTNVVSGSLDRTGVEKTVLLQEIGHILGLVNISYHSPRDHEDPDHPNHSKSRQSVMYWAVTTADVASVFRGGPPDKFDTDDLADLADLRANRI